MSAQSPNDMFHPDNFVTTDDLLRAVTESRQFPNNTCPASRHVEMIGRVLAKRRPYHMIEEEPERVGGSLLRTVDALYRARSDLAAARARIAALTEELEAYRHAAMYDALMSGPAFKGWNRSQLDQARKLTEAALAAPGKPEETRGAPRPPEDNGQAVIRDGAIIIRLPLDYLPQVVEGAWACNALDKRFKLTDVAAFAKEMVRELNREDEQGTTPMHKLFDAAINEALEQGAEGIEEHEEQDA